jgi:uncharacterized OB-fold protein
MTTAAAAELKPVVPFLKYGKDGAPYLAGSKCSKCGEVFVGEREVCAKCGTRGKMDAKRLSDTGKLYNFTIVHRNFPGVPVPFVSAIVDLDGGGTLKGNLIGVEPDPKKLPFDMPVKVVYRDAGRKDKEGNSYHAYFFAPA